MDVMTLNKPHLKFGRGVLYEQPKVIENKLGGALEALDRCQIVRLDSRNLMWALNCPVNFEINVTLGVFFNVLFKTLTDDALSLLATYCDVNLFSFIHELHAKPVDIPEELKYINIEKVFEVSKDNRALLHVGNRARVVIPNLTCLPLKGFNWANLRDLSLHLDTIGQVSDEKTKGRLSNPGVYKLVLLNSNGALESYPPPRTTNKTKLGETFSMQFTFADVCLGLFQSLCAFGSPALRDNTMAQTTYLEKIKSERIHTAKNKFKNLIDELHHEVGGEKLDPQLVENSFKDYLKFLSANGNLPMPELTLSPAGAVVASWSNHTEGLTPQQKCSVSIEFLSNERTQFTMITPDPHNKDLKNTSSGLMGLKSVIDAVNPVIRRLTC